MEISRRELIIGSMAMMAVLPSTDVVAGLISDTPVPVKKDFLVPSIRFVERVTTIANTEMNVFTHVYQYMDRFFLDENGKLKGIGTVHVNKNADIYEDWLRDTGPYDIPPHIGFGGAIVAGEGDPLFKKKWENHTKLLLLTGEIA